MALKLPMTDRYGNEYPEGYRKFAFLAVDPINRNIRVVFNNYRDQDWRHGHLNGFFSQTEYAVGPAAIPPVLDADGNMLAPPTPSYDDFANPDAQAENGIGALVYGYAKTRPDSAGAVDVIEK